MNHAHAGVMFGVGIKNARGTISRAIVHDDKLKITTSLPQNTVNRRFHGRSGVICGDEDGYLWRAHRVFHCRGSLLPGLKSVKEVEQLAASNDLTRGNLSFRIRCATNPVEAELRRATDGQLVLRAAAGDDSAFDELVARYRTRVYHLALSKVRGRENALDIAQEAFVQAYLSLRSLREPEKFGSWLSGITANLCKMHFRKSSDVVLAPEMIEDMQTRAEPDPNAALAREALDQLPNGTRSAAILYFVEEMKQTEIAEFLGISLAAVKSRIRDARASLQKEMIHMVKQTAKKQEPGDEFTMSLKHRLELAMWYREFSEMIYAGTNIMRALDTIRQGDYSEAIRQQTTQMMDAIQAEATVFEALEACPALQTPEALGLIDAGERGGMLELTSRSLVDFLELRGIQESIEIAILCRTIGGLILGRNELATVLKHAVGIAQSDFARQLTREMLKSVESGGTLTAAVTQYSELLPIPMLRATEAGERSGTLGYALNWAADQIADHVAHTLASRRPYPTWMSEEECALLSKTFLAALAEVSPPE